MRNFPVVVLLILCLCVSANVLALINIGLEDKSDCLACHMSLVSQIDVHFIESNSDCQFCHFSQDYNLHVFQTEFGNDLCLACHVEQDMLNSKNSHESLYCADCHNPHSSNNDFRLRKNVVNLCAESCHVSHTSNTSHPVGKDLTDSNTGGD